MLPRSIHHIHRLAARPIQPVTIQELLSRSAAVTDRSHLQHAQWIRQEMPVRLAHRLSDYLQLPFVVVCNTRFNEVFRLFLHAFETLVDSPEIKDERDVEQFSVTLRGLVRSTDDMVHMLQEGYGELQALLDGLVDLDDFLNQIFFTRIGNRVLAEHFLTVHKARANGLSDNIIGVVDPRCRPAEQVQQLAKSLGELCCDLYGDKPKVVLDGQLDTELSFVPEHLSFMLQEILKNAFRATVERHLPAREAIPPVNVSVMKGSFDVTIKVSDRGGGMRQDQLEQIWRYGYTSTRETTSPSTAGDDLSGLCGQDDRSFRQIAGYGFGLPLSRVYAQYFGGDIHVQSMRGYGTDVYLNINHLGDVLEFTGDESREAKLQDPHTRFVAS
ncbi:unnamed protein product [Polarella glacialis]|uniref:Protein-serine/threonine kinase n=1 Tax=Polarella glacialis TaxID=89957 RepID=A0A813JUD7_POLGL|nr:unnamed protein product [Polarella glacialis]